MHIPWDDLQVFLAVAEAGSLSAAAKKLRVTQPTVSRRIAELESSVGEALFVRTVDGAAPTSFGERLLEPARRMAEWAAEVDRAAERAETKPRGTVRITAPPGIAFEFLAPFAAWMATRLPDVTLEVVSTVAYLDLSRRDADLALRFAAPTQRDVMVLGRLDLEVGAFASETYAKTLAKRGRLQVPDVRWIAWAPPFDHLSPNSELAKAIPGFRPSFASDDFLVQLRAAEAGLGAMFLGRVEHRFASAPTLVEIDVEVAPIRQTLFLVGARGALEIARVRAVADLLARELAKVVAKKAPRGRSRAAPSRRGVAQR
jgi:DNA-binding transcriptional LysR family regulator